MQIEQLSIINFKNLEQVELFPSPKINCFIGLNGMGKTNLLDAIYYLSFCKSFTNTTDTQSIRHDEEFSIIQGWYKKNNDQNLNSGTIKADEYFCCLRHKQKKQFKYSKKEYDRLSDHIGKIPLVLISPGDNELISGGSEDRRKFLDLFLSQFDKMYLHELINYNKALTQRNALLKNRNLIDNSLLDILDERLCEEGQKIYDKRKEFIKHFIPHFQEIYSSISPSTEKVTLTYKSDFEYSDFKELIKQKRIKDIERGHTSVGIHRDNLEMLINGYALRKEGSQGQNKSYIVALKLAQFNFLKQITNTTPLLLLDDIFDKLDASRVKRIIDLVLNKKFGQIFITDTNREHIDEILSNSETNYHLYNVENGNITQKNRNCDT